MRIIYDNLQEFAETIERCALLDDGGLCKYCVFAAKCPATADDDLEVDEHERFTVQCAEIAEGSEQ